ncbi:hypothetical protein [Sediminibacillus massiliensis]|uniref:hypothetical protein n=1 Tax=Sediminibacillus massiliensis TaxID=1926277 RepID=UPI0009884377|nr:hypothetical protein [Sediminibacillus massiliensis]
MDNREVISYIRKHFPNTATNKVAKHLNISTYQVRTIAKKHNIRKSSSYLKSLKTELVNKRRNWYLSNIPDFNPSYFQEQILLGSLLGDGYISKGAKRSKNFYYQEHFGNRQLEYRQWKLSQLEDLGFSLNGTFLNSISHPYFTDLYPLLYENDEKILSLKLLTKCTHPIFLTTLDDGSLVLSYKYN